MIIGGLVGWRIYCIRKFARQAYMPYPGVCVMNPDLALSRDPPAPVLYWQPTHLPIYIRVRLDLTLTQHDFALLMLVLWLLLADQ